MNKKILMIALSLGLIILTSKCYAASSLRVSSSSVNVGNTFKVTAKVWNVGAWQMNVNVTGPVKLVSGTTSDPDGSTTDGANGSRTLTSTYKVTGVGNITVDFTGNATDENVNKEYINWSKTVIGKAKTITSNTNTNTNTNTTTTTTTTAKKSSNAKIKALTVDVEGLAPSFKKDVTSYKLTVGNNINKLKMTMTLDDDGATYRITGNKDFKEGENIVKIIVTAENKTTTKTYKITVIKTPDLRLNTLNISNAEFVKEFDPDVYEYNLRDIESDIKKLNITAISVNDSAIIKIAGNDTLVTGENIIKIVVSDKNEEHSKVYTLKVNKLEKSLETLSDDAEIVEKNSYIDNIKGKFEIYEQAIKINATIILLYLLALVEFFQVIYLYKQLKSVNPEYDKIIIKRVNKDKKQQKPIRRNVNIDIDIEDKK